MAFQDRKPHILMFPFMAQGHVIPLIDIAKLLGRQGASIIVVAIGTNALRFKPTLSRAVEQGLEMSLIELDFPYEEAGLPEGCDNLDAVPSPDLIKNLFDGASMVLDRSLSVFEALSPRPDCIVSDMFVPWTIKISRILGVPRISFNGLNCFTLLSLHNLAVHKFWNSVCSDDTERFVIPDLPDRIEMTRAQLPGALGPNLEGYGLEIAEAEAGSHGMIVNSFEELEPKYVERYKEVQKGKAWCVGPVSLCNKELLDKAHRGNKSTVDESEVLEWLNSKKHGSVVYVCLGSLSKFATAQLIELGLGLEASNKPFVWVIGGRKSLGDEPRSGLDEWIEKDGFEGRVGERGLLIRGWAPQVLILSHPAVGGFLTHCGWNSTLEGICSGLPLITWPLFADQFMNEKLVVQVLSIAVTLGVREPVRWGEEEKMGVKVKRETIERALARLMDEGDKGESRERRERARKLGDMAKLAVVEGGSSYNNITSLLKHITSQT